MIDLNEYQTLKREVEVLQRKSDKAAGALDQLKRRLKEEFGCNTLAEGRKLLAKRQIESAEIETEYNKALGKFKEEWGEALS